MRSILTAAGEGIYGVDAEGILTFVNPSATRILGFEADELIGRNGHAIFHHIADARHVRRHHRHAGGHRFDQNQPKSLGGGGENQHIH